MKPCSHDPLLPESCYLCWLAIWDRRYQQLWGLPLTAPLTRPPKPGYVGKGFPTRLPCKHEGAVVEWCMGCNGEMKHVRDCDVHEKCTRLLCLNCPGYESLTS